MMMKALRVLLIGAVILLLLVSCNSKTYKYNYTFNGEGEQWAAEYVQKASTTLTDKKGVRPEYSSSNERTFQLKYKGKQTDLGDIKELKYSYKGTTGGGSSTIEGPVHFGDLKSRSVSNGSIEQEDAVIQVEVEWDGQKEQFELQVPKK
ncbi:MULTISPECIES: hypothetical protein [unclassified Paenibacillus]|uniref:hypothetical protein n=1 Tax=unclassified Paenibacillus TaxID=185978 RepID=UPI0036CD23D7